MGTKRKYLIGFVDYKTKSILLYLIIGVSAAFLLLLIVFLAIIIIHCRKNKKKTKDENPHNMEKINNKDGKNAFDYVGPTPPPRPDMTNNGLSFLGLNNATEKLFHRFDSTSSEYPDTTLRREKSLRFDNTYINDIDKSNSVRTSVIYDNNLDHNTAKEIIIIPGEVPDSSSKEPGRMEPSLADKEDTIKHDSVNSDMVKIRNRLRSDDSYQDKTLSLARTISFENEYTDSSNINNKM